MILDSFSHKLSDLLLPAEEFYVTVNNSYLNTGGVYVLRSFDEMGKAITIPRVLSDDIEGVLYIGKANLFCHRTGDLARSLSSRHLQSKHHAGQRYLSDTRYQERYPLDYLRVFRWASDYPTEIEQSFLQNYLAKFGDRPPLNRV